MDWMDDFEHEMRRIRSEMDRVFDRFVTRSRLPAQVHKDRKHLLEFREPMTHIAETEKSYLLSFELPDVKKGDIELFVHGNQVELRVRSKEKHDKESKDASMRTYASQEFQKTVSLPLDADAKGVHATYRDGMLRIEFPKHVGGAPKRLDIR